MKKLFSAISLILFSFSLVSPTLASTLSFSPSNGTFNQKCSFSLDVLMDTKGVSVEGADAYINFDSARFNLTTIDTVGKIFPEYPGSSIDTINPNKVFVSGIATAGRPYTGSGKLATLLFTVKDGAQTGATQITFDFDPNAGPENKFKDSNVVSNSQQSGTVVDTLTAVTNGSYIVGTGVCSAGASPSPTTAPGATNVNTGGPGDSFESTPAGQPKTLDELVDEKAEGPGTAQETYTIAIVGSILTVLGILGLALL